LTPLAFWLPPVTDRSLRASFFIGPSHIRTYDSFLFCWRPAIPLPICLPVSLLRPSRKNAAFLYGSSFHELVVHNPASMDDALFPSPRSPLGIVFSRRLSSYRSLLTKKASAPLYIRTDALTRPQPIFDPVAELYPFHSYFGSSQVGPVTLLSLQQNPHSSLLELNSPIDNSPSSSLPLPLPLAWSQNTVTA